MQHSPVYTLGSGSSCEHLGFNPNNPPFPLYRTERGGEVTYHGPGQLVAYPVINLRYFKQDLHWYLRSLEEVVIRCVGLAFGLLLLHHCHQQHLFSLEEVSGPQRDYAACQACEDTQEVATTDSVVQHQMTSWLSAELMHIPIPQVPG